MADPVSSLSSLAREAFAAARARLDQGASATGPGSQALEPTGAAGDLFERAFETRARDLFERTGAEAADLSLARSSTSTEQDNLLQRVLEGVDEPVRAAERLPLDMLEGRVSSPAEIAATVKRADLTFKYSLEIRNRLVDAYREVMRMSV